MLLTNQQKFMLATLKRLGCLRERQLVDLFRPVFCAKRPELAEWIVQCALRQLRHGSMELVMENGLIMLPGVSFSGAFLDAIDVMLQISGAAPLDYEVPNPPFLLRFSVPGEHIRVFSVIDGANADKISAPGRAERVVILLSGNEAAKPLPFPNKQFFAKRQEDGNFKFFSARTT